MQEIKSELHSYSELEMMKPVNQHDNQAASISRRGDQLKSQVSQHFYKSTTVAVHMFLYAQVSFKSVFSNNSSQGLLRYMLYLHCVPQVSTPTTSILKPSHFAWRFLFSSVSCKWEKWGHPCCSWKKLFPRWTGTIGKRYIDNIYKSCGKVGQTPHKKFNKTFDGLTLWCSLKQLLCDCVFSCLSQLLYFLPLPF